MSAHAWLSPAHRERALRILSRLPEVTFLDVLMSLPEVRKADPLFVNDALSEREHFETTPVATVLNQLETLMTARMEPNDPENAAYLQAVAG